jgi:putative transposase
MPEYRRNRVAGGTYFFTVNILDRRSDLLVRHIDVLREAARKTHHRSPFRVDAWVVLPDHMHCIWTLPSGDDAYPARWTELKKAFSKAMPAQETRTLSRRHQGERGVWQRRYWEHTIRDDADYAAHMDYVHFNPVKHGLAGRVVDWPFSSFHRAVRDGHYPVSWSGSGIADIECGEAVS